MMFTNSVKSLASRPLTRVIPLTIFCFLIAGLYLGFQVRHYIPYGVDGRQLVVGFPFVMLESAPFASYAGDPPPPLDDTFQRLSRNMDFSIKPTGIILNALCLGSIGMFTSLCLWKTDDEIDEP